MDSRLPLTSAPLPHLLIIPTCNFASFEACVPSEADLRCGRRVQGLRGISCEQGSASSIVNNTSGSRVVINNTSGGTHIQDIQINNPRGQIDFTSDGIRISHQTAVDACEKIVSEFNDRQLCIQLRPKQAHCLLLRQRRNHDTLIPVR